MGRCDNERMDDDDKNGGPNHLAAWLEYRGINQTELAKAVDTTPHQISYLVNSERALSAKWLRRLAPHLRTTPGHLLDHDPRDLPNDVREMWLDSSPEQQRQIIQMMAIIMGKAADA